LLAFMLYQWKKIDPDKLAGKLKTLYKISLNKWYIDEIYHATVIAGALGWGRMLSWFDANIVDGIVNGTSTVTRFFSRISNWFDTFVVDGLVNLSAMISGFIGLTFRRLQTGKVQSYILFVVFSVLIIIIVFQPF